jgi:hypothetical protein
MLWCDGNSMKFLGQLRDQMMELAFMRSELDTVTAESAFNHLFENDIDESRYPCLADLKKALESIAEKSATGKRGARPTMPNLTAPAARAGVAADATMTAVTTSRSNAASLAAAAPSANAPSAVTTSEPGRPRDTQAAKRKKEERMKQRQDNLLMHLKSTAKSALPGLFPGSANSARTEYSSFGTLVEAHYALKIFEGCVDWGDPLTEGEREDLEKRFDNIKDDGLFTEKHRWHEQLDGPVFVRGENGFVMARILQDRLDQLWPGRSSRKSIRDLWTRASFARGPRCVRQILRAVLEHFVGEDRDKSSRPFPRGQTRITKIFSRAEITEILTANLYNHPSHFTESSATTKFAIWTTPILVPLQADQTGNYGLHTDFVLQFEDNPACTLDTLARDMPIRPAAQIKLTQKCQVSFDSWRSANEGFRCERYETIRGRTYNEIQSAELKIRRTVGDPEKKRYGPEDLLYDMERGYIEFN